MLLELVCWCRLSWNTPYSASSPSIITALLTDTCSSRTTVDTGALFLIAFTCFCAKLDLWHLRKALKHGGFCGLMHVRDYRLGCLHATCQYMEMLGTEAWKYCLELRAGAEAEEWLYDVNWRSWWKTESVYRSAWKLSEVWFVRANGSVYLGRVDREITYIAQGVNGKQLSCRMITV